MEAEYVTAEIEFPVDAKSIKMHRAMLLALRQVNDGKATFRFSQSAFDAVGNRFTTHPDRLIVEEWLRPPKATEEDEMKVIYFLSIHVLTEWETLPKKTKAQHIALYKEIADTAQKLITLLENTDSYYYRGGGHGLSHASIADLLTDDEDHNLLKPLTSFYEKEFAKFKEPAPPPGNWFPSVKDILNRVADAADRLKVQGPVHSQPNKRGARNGFFVRRLYEILCQRYGDVPMKVVASIASIALDEIIDDDLAAKHAKLGERSKAR